MDGGQDGISPKGDQKGNDISNSRSSISHYRRSSHSRIAITTHSRTHIYSPRVTTHSFSHPDHPPPLKPLSEMPPTLRSGAQFPIQSCVSFKFIFHIGRFCSFFHPRTCHPSMHIHASIIPCTSMHPSFHAHPCIHHSMHFHASIIPCTSMHPSFHALPCIHPSMHFHALSSFHALCSSLLPGLMITIK